MKRAKEKEKINIAEQKGISIITLIMLVLILVLATVIIVFKLDLFEGTKTESMDNDFKKYILGENETGRSYKSIFDWNDYFLDDPDTPADETKTLDIKFLNCGRNEDETKDFIYAKYNNKVYKIVIDFKTQMTEKIELIYTPQGREGQDLGVVTGKEEYYGWTILYDNGTAIEAVSPTAIGELRLGYKENTSDEAIQLAEAIDSYNDAIEIINDYCRSDSVSAVLPINDGVRSVGAEKEKTTDKYFSTTLESSNPTCNGVGLKGDINYEQDLVRMSYWGVYQVGDEYYFASRISPGEARTSHIEGFGIRISSPSLMRITGTGLWGVYDWR